MKKPQGFKAFIVVVIGQIISFLGSGMTGFAMAIWIFEQNGSATEFSLLAVTGVAPIIIFSPFAGVLVDRWNRKLVMMLSDIAAGLTTIIMLILFSTGNLEVWHLYVLGFFSGIFQAFQFPAFSASMSLMVPKEQYGRAAGLNSLAGPTAQILAPLMAAAFIHVIGVQGIMIIDIITFIVAIGVLFFVVVPQPDKKEETADSGEKKSIFIEASFGFKYILSKPSLFGLLTVFFVINFVISLVFVLMVPMVLSIVRTNPEGSLGSVMTLGAAGGLLGGLILSAWGGPKKRVNGILIGMALEGVFGIILMGLGKSLGDSINIMVFGLGGAALVWGFSRLFGGIILNILQGSSNAIWMSKVPPELQGRVFSARLWIAQIITPVAMIIAGPLADKALEPAMAGNGAYAAIFGPIVGTGAGTGIASLFVICGVLVLVISLAAFLFPAIRNIDTLLPDYDAEQIDEEPELESV